MLAPELRQPAPLARGEPAWIREPQVMAFLQRRRDLLLRAPHQVHRVVQVLDQVVAIEGDGDVGEIPGGAQPIARRHVHAQLGELRWLAAMGFKVLFESAEALGIAPLGTEDGARPIEVDEHRHVVVPAAPAGLIHPETTDGAEVLRGPRPVDVEMDDAPDPVVVFLEEPRQGMDRHLLG